MVHRSLERPSRSGGNDPGAKRLAAFDGRFTILRTSFAEAAEQFADGFFDFIYIDGYAHTGQDQGRTLADWWPRLKTGGIFAGHDYCATYPQTVKVVDEFAAGHYLELQTTDEERYASLVLR